MKSWHQMTWQEIGDLPESGMNAVMLPIGATEQHGPHMGCGMDAEIAFQLCRAVANETKIAMLPTLPYGCSLGHSKRWPGTLAIQPKTLIDVVKQIGDWVYASGFKRLFIINAHVTNQAPLRCALEMLRAEYDDIMVALINSPDVSDRVRQHHYHDTEDCVFAHPVNRTSTNGVTGKPSLASKEKGQQLFSWMVEDLSDLVRKGLKETPPLPHSYFKKVNQGDTL